MKENNFDRKIIKNSFKKNGQYKKKDLQKILMKENNHASRHGGRDDKTNTIEKRRPRRENGLGLQLIKI